MTGDAKGRPTVALKLNPGLVIVIFLNVILLCGVPFFPREESPRFIPLVALVLVTPWLLYWVIGRVIAYIMGEQAKKREQDDPSDFV